LNNLPLDAVWSDIDYMNEYEDFTVDSKRFDLSEMRTMMDLQKNDGVHWVPIIDAGISVRHADYCLERNCYILSNRYDGAPLMGCVWPGKVHYPDFNHPDAWDMWHNGLENITTVYGLTPSGFWIDMNEFSNFVNGEIPADGQCQSSSPLMVIFDEEELETDLAALDAIEHTHVHNEYIADSSNPFNDLPFNPSGVAHPLDEKTISLDAYFYNKDNAKVVKYDGGRIWHYDFHSLLGFTEGIATNNALVRLGKKLKFIVSRSSMFGSGRYVTIWQGDSVSNWDWLANSIPYLFNSQLFSIPFTGSDICGFGGDATAELCARWMTLGTLYPFSRNHNGLDSRS
jgi:alpha-glucosidase (family GH31 glycosyl hydrolase)